MDAAQILKEIEFDRQMISITHQVRNDNHFAEFLFEIFLYELAAAVPPGKSSISLQFKVLKESVDMAIAYTRFYEATIPSKRKKNESPFELYVATAPYALSISDIYIYLKDEWRVKRLFTKEIGLDRTKTVVAQFPLSCTLPALTQEDHDHFWKTYRKINPEFYDRYATIVYACRRYVWPHQGSRGYSDMLDNQEIVEKYTKKFIDQQIQQEAREEAYAATMPVETISATVGLARSDLNKAKKKLRKATASTAAAKEGSAGPNNVASSSSLPFVSSSAPKNTFATESDTQPSTATSTQDTATSMPPRLEEESALETRLDTALAICSTLRKQATLVICDVEAFTPAINAWNLQHSIVMTYVLTWFNIGEARRRTAVDRAREKARERAALVAKEREEAAEQMRTNIKRACHQSLEINKHLEQTRCKVEKARLKAQSSARKKVEKQEKRQEKKRRRQEKKLATPTTATQNGITNGSSSSSPATASASASTSTNKSTSAKTNGSKTHIPLTERELLELAVVFQETGLFLDEYVLLVAQKLSRGMIGPMQLIAMAGIKEQAMPHVLEIWNNPTTVRTKLIQFLDRSFKEGMLTSQEVNKLMVSYGETWEKKRQKISLGNSLMKDCVDSMVAGWDGFGFDNLDNYDHCDSDANRTIYDPYDYYHDDDADDEWYSAIDDEDPGGVPDAETVTESDEDSEGVPDAETVTESDGDSEGVPDAETVTESDGDSEGVPDAEMVTESDGDSEGVPDAETVTESDEEHGNRQPHPHMASVNGSRRDDHGADKDSRNADEELSLPLFPNKDMVITLPVGLDRKQRGQVYVDKVKAYWIKSVNIHARVSSIVQRKKSKKMKNAFNREVEEQTTLMVEAIAEAEMEVLNREAQEIKSRSVDEGESDLLTTEDELEISRSLRIPKAADFMWNGVHHYVMQGLGQPNAVDVRDTRLRSTIMVGLDLCQKKVEGRIAKQNERRAQKAAAREKKRLDERIIQEQAERVAKEEAVRIAKAQAERAAREKSEKVAKEKAEHVAREEAERAAKMKAERIAKEKAEYAAKEEAKRIAKEEAERAAKEETKRVANEEAERAAKAEADRIAARKEAERLTKTEVIEVEKAAKEKMDPVEETGAAHEKPLATLVLHADKLAKEEAVLKAMFDTKNVAILQRQQELELLARTEQFKAARIQDVMLMRAAAETKVETNTEVVACGKDQEFGEKYQRDAQERKVFEGRINKFKNERAEEVKSMRSAAQEALINTSPTYELHKLEVEKAAREYEEKRKEREGAEQAVEKHREMVAETASAERKRLQKEKKEMKALKRLEAMEEKRLKQEANNEAQIQAHRRGEPVRLPNNNAIYYDWKGIDFTLALWKVPFEHFEGMEAWVDHWYIQLLPQPESFVHRASLLDRLQLLFTTEFPSKGLQLLPFGSYITGLGNTWSDIDICVFVNPGNFEPYAQHSDVTHLAQFLKKHGMQEVVAIADAKVPIIKFVDPATQIKCDLNVQHPLGIYNSQLIKTYLEIDARLGKLLYLLKYFAKGHGILDGSSGFLCSYAYILMVIVFLQGQRDPILPRLQVKSERPKNVNEYGKPRKTVPNFGECIQNDILAKTFVRQDNKVYDCSFDTRTDLYKSYGLANKKTVAQLLFEFFEFFARRFDYRTMEVSSLHGRIQERHAIAKEKRQQLALGKISGGSGSYNLNSTLSKSPYIYDSKRQLWLSESDQAYFRDLSAGIVAPPGTPDAISSSSTLIDGSTASATTISTPTATGTSSRGSRYQDRFGSEAFLCVIDPFIFNRNVAATCRGDRLGKVWKCFDHAYKCFALGKFAEAFQPIESGE
ncbi:hypothetical protein BG011_008562 [Mortierella polycephala]|uniref:Poly(A) RNA polymerase mitochondrial-like central palm domain-containing protein n=1 Tax=Mortierella polycephala TaxID=41804 RepID=A0A9P6PNT0_9FUNG|nr:hypothetical protein BG011_008562 [Mortierella polycephala]